MSKYVQVNGMLYVRTDSEDAPEWKSDAKKLYNTLLGVWLNDGSTKKVRRELDSPPEKLQEYFEIYVSELLDSHNLIDWQQVYDDLHKEDK